MPVPQERLTSVTYQGVATQTRYTFHFDYLNKKFVKVLLTDSLYGTEQELTQNIDYTVYQKEITLNTPTNKIIKIYRKTDTLPTVSWEEGSVLRATDLTLQDTQVYHLIEESVEGNKTNSEILNDAIHLANSAKTSENNAATSATNAANSASQAATSATSAANSASTDPVITVKGVRFKAKGDGVTDDTTEIAAAIASLPAGGGTVFFPPGKYIAGDFTYPQNVKLLGINAFLVINGQEIGVPMFNQTTTPIKYYVATTGNANNHGLSASCPLSKPTDALKRMPDIILHDVVVRIANGTYVENTMLDEWGRVTGIDIGHKVIMPERIATDATYPDGGYNYATNKKWGKLTFYGESMVGVIIDGNAKHARDGFKTRARNVMVYNMTFQNFHTGFVAHEGGAVAGYNITVQDCTNLLMAESQMAKIELDNVTLRRGISYNIYNVNGQISIGNLTLDVDSNDGITQTEGSCNLSGIINVKGACSAGKIYAGTFDFDGTLTGDATAYGFYFYSGKVRLDGTFKSIRQAYEARGSVAVIMDTCHFFDLDRAFTQLAGTCRYNNLDSLDGATQKYNRVAGAVLAGGGCLISPYHMQNFYKVKGIEGKPATNLIIRHKGVSAYPAPHKAPSTAAYSATGWAAGALGSDINNFLGAVRGASDTTEYLLTPVLLNINKMTAFNVNDCRLKMVEIANAFVDAGMIRADLTATWYPASSGNNQADHDIVRAGFNKMLTDLIAGGYMEI